MENTIYRVNDFDGNHELEFYICTTNTVEPYIKTKDLGIIIFNDEGLQLDSSLDKAELDSLIRYLEDCRRYINKFNKDRVLKNE